MKRIFGVLVLLVVVAAVAQGATFVIYYDDQDAATIAGNLTRADLTTEERQIAQKVWNGGMKDWATAPFALSPFCDDPNTFPVTSHRIVITAQGLTKEDLAAVLTSVGTRLGPGLGGYLTTLALDVLQCSE